MVNILIWIIQTITETTIFHLNYVHNAYNLIRVNKNLLTNPMNAFVLRTSSLNNSQVPYVSNHLILRLLILKHSLSIRKVKIILQETTQHFQNPQRARCLWINSTHQYINPKATQDKLNRNTSIHCITSKMRSSRMTRTITILLLKTNRILNLQSLRSLSLAKASRSSKIRCWTTKQHWNGIIQII